MQQAPAPKLYDTKELLRVRHQAAMRDLEEVKPFWWDISRRMAPRTGRFLVSDRGRSGRDKHNQILDNCAIDAQNKLAAGWVSGACSPARPWFRTVARSPRLARKWAVRKYCEAVDQVIMRVLRSIGFYDDRYEDFRQLAVFGNTGGLLLEDDLNLISYQPWTIGEFSWSWNNKRQIDSTFREFAMTCSQLVQEFGWDNVSQEVKTAWNAGNLSHWFTVCHTITPMAQHGGSALGIRKRWLQAFWEKADTNCDSWLRVSGFDRFPAICTTWSRQDGETFGVGPGAFAFGDAGQLQHAQYRKGQVIDFGTFPAQQGPPSLKDQETEFLPGGITITERPGTEGLRPIWQPTVPLTDLHLDIEDVRKRIRTSFLSDLFSLMQSLNDSTERTAVEIRRREEEALVQIGPVVARVNASMFQPQLQLAYQVALQRGMLPEAPADLDGEALDLEFISVFSQAQRMIDASAMDRYLGTLAVVGRMNQEALDTINWDAIVEGYGERLGISPTFSYPADQVAEVRRTRAAALAAKEQSAMMAEASGSIRNLAQAPAGNGTALDIASQLTGYNAPRP